jgi:predicted RNase H-like HicB family nuclease
MRKRKSDEYTALPYRCELYFDKEDDAWIIRFPELPGCIADGSTPEEAFRAGEEAKSLWLETAIDHGDDVPLPEPEPLYSGRLVLRLPKGLHTRAARAAQREGVSLNTYLVQAVTESVERSGITNMLRFIGGNLERFFTKAGPGSYLLSLLVKPIYGEKDEPAALEEVAELPSVPLRGERHAP